MVFERVVRVSQQGPGGPWYALSNEVIDGCWFELLRRGGCGAGELRLRTAFGQRGQVQAGDWVACEGQSGERWYLGRVEERLAVLPARVRLQLQGMSVQLGEVFPGEFRRQVDGRAPHRYGATDLFPHDPDYADETVDVVTRVEELVERLLAQYVSPLTDIACDSGCVEWSSVATPLRSAKFNGEESVRSLLKDLALRCGDAAWGVDEAGRFFFRQARTTVLARWRVAREVLALEEASSRRLLFNRVLLTGGFLYEPGSGESGRAAPYRWRANYRHGPSVSRHGAQRIRLWAPWVRTSTDSREFVRAFFQRYAVPVNDWRMKACVVSPPRPWDGEVVIEDAAGGELTRGQPDVVRVLSDRAPQVEVRLGPGDPRELWAEPAHDERWPVAPVERPGESEVSYGSSLGSLSLWSFSSQGGGGGGESSAEGTSDVRTSSEATSSEVTSSDVSSSEVTSDEATSVATTSGDVTSSDGVSSTRASSDVISSDAVSSDVWSSVATSHGEMTSSAASSDEGWSSSGAGVSWPSGDSWWVTSSGAASSAMTSSAGGNSSWGTSWVGTSTGGSSADGSSAVGSSNGGTSMAVTSGGSTGGMSSTAGLSSTGGASTVWASSAWGSSGSSAAGTSMGGTSVWSSGMGSSLVGTTSGGPWSTGGATSTGGGWSSGWSSAGSGSTGGSLGSWWSSTDLTSSDATSSGGSWWWSSTSLGTSGW